MYTKEQFDELKAKVEKKYNVGQKFDINDFKMIMSLLRTKEYGCPWDSVQTHDSITQGLIEECYEVIEAIKDKDDDNLREELGDVLMQVVMHSEIASERDSFDFEDVVEEISRKMIRRHPKVFTGTNDNPLNSDGNENKINNINNENVQDSEIKADNDPLNLSLWEKIKAEEKKGSKEAEKGPLNRVASSLPALIRAQKVIKKSDQLYGDSPKVDESVKILKKHVEKLEKGLEKGGEYSNIDKILGDILLEITNIAYRMEENAENSLTKSIEAFINKRVSDKQNIQITVSDLNDIKERNKK